MCVNAVSYTHLDVYKRQGDNDSFDIGRHIKEKYEHIPIVILTPFSHGITKRIINEDLSAFEYRCDYGDDSEQPGQGCGAASPRADYLRR